MKTVPFNEEQAKAGRPVATRLLDPYHVDVVCVEKDWAWCREPYGYNRPATYRIDALFHPAAPAPGHNPLGLDEWTVGTHRGGRLLAEAEIDLTRPLTGDIEAWVGGSWVRLAGGNSTGNTYRTHKPPGYFLPKPKTRMIRPDELPELFIWRESEKEAHPYVTKLSNWADNEIQSAVREGWQWSRSLDGPWRPFTVEETP